MKDVYTAFLILILSALPMLALAGGGRAAEDTQASIVPATGVVQQVKPEQGRIKINHDPIPALGWPKMTMYFRVKDKAMLEGIAAGDKVRFELEKGDTGLVITRMEKVAQ